MSAQLWTVNALSVELERDRRSLGRLLEMLPPDDVSQSGSRTIRRWRMARVVRHLYDVSDDLDLSEQRARLAKVQADRHELELSVRRGELREEREMLEEFGGIISDARARLIQLPDAIGQVCDPKYAPIIVAEVRRRVYEALTDLSRDTSHKTGNGSEL